jgi:glutamyl-tRNA reductase
LVIGLNYRTAPVAVRERFWINEERRSEALAKLIGAEGIEEVVILATCNRTEFLLWADDAALAADSVLRFLTAHYGLKICDWKHFYRLLDDEALVHLFRVTASLDSMMIGESQIVSQVNAAWQQAQKVGSCARFLDSVLQKALTVSKRVRSETATGSAPFLLPYAAVEVAKEAIGSLENRRVLLLGAGKMGELSARGLMNRGASPVIVVNRTYEHAVELANKLGGTAVAYENRWQEFLRADVIISSTSCPTTILSRDEAEKIAQQRSQRPLVLVDIALPRGIDPSVRKIPGIFLYDIDDLERIVQPNPAEYEQAAAEAQKIVTTEAQGFRQKLLAERVVPTIIALRHRLDEICRQELDSFKNECGPFSQDQGEVLDAVTSRLTQRIAGSLARELKELPERAEQEQLTTAVQRLFHLESPQRALAGTRL